VTLNDRNFDTRISRLVRYRRYRTGCTCLCTYGGGIESKGETGRETVYLSPHPYFPLSQIPRRRVVAGCRWPAAYLRLRDSSIQRESESLPSSTVHTPLASIVACPGFRPRRVFHSGAVCSPILRVNCLLGKFTR